MTYKDENGLLKELNELVEPYQDKNDKAIKQIDRLYLESLDYEERAKVLSEREQQKLKEKEEQEQKRLQDIKNEQDRLERQKLDQIEEEKKWQRQLQREQENLYIKQHIEGNKSRALYELEGLKAELNHKQKKLEDAKYSHAQKLKAEHTTGLEHALGAWEYMSEDSKRGAAYKIQEQEKQVQELIHKVDIKQQEIDELEQELSKYE